MKFYGDKSGVQNVLHICADNRIEQYRGEPYLAPVIETLKNVSRYADAELQSAIIKSFFSIFFIQPLSNLELQQIADEVPADEPCTEIGEFRLGSGTISALPRGIDVKSIDASNAQSTFEAFTGQFLRQIAAGLNLPVEVLLKSFNSSYSASKAALLQAEEEFKQRRAAFIQDFCKPVYELFLTEAI